MNKKRSIVYYGVAIIVIMLFSFNDKPSIIPKANNYLRVGDTTSFAPNIGGSWGVLSSYLNQDKPDSAAFELILKRMGGIDGSNEYFIGTITNPSFIPVSNQQLDYYLLMDNVWSVRITTNGKCYLKQKRGTALNASTLPGNPTVIPIKIRYKNK